MIILEDHPSQRGASCTRLSLTLCLAGIAKFIISDGMKGIRAGYRATGKKALTSLRNPHCSGYSRKGLFGP